MQEKAVARAHQNQVEQELIRFLEYPSGTRLGVWSEVRVKYVEKLKTFNYAFDYIVMPIGKQSQTLLLKQLGGEWRSWRSKMQTGGYTISRRGDEDFVEDAQ